MGSGVCLGSVNGNAGGLMACEIIDNKGKIPDNGSGAYKFESANSRLSKLLEG